MFKNGTKVLSLGLFALLLASAGLAGNKPATAMVKDVYGITAQDVAQAFTEYLNRESAPMDGWIRIEDPLENRTLELKLKEVYSKALLKSKTDTYIACGIFETRDGTTYDVDFYLKGNSRANLKVVDASIHSKNGVTRYAWAEEKGLMRLKPISSAILTGEQMGH
jgi:hypothetical protein